MSKDIFTKNRVRKYFGKIREVAEMPNLIEVQKSSYELFLNSGDGAEPLKGEGIRGAFESIFPIKDFNFQNYLEFPVLFKKKEKIHKYLMSKGFDLKKIHYFNCSKEFKNKYKCYNSERIEKEILCLPNHEKINNYYIDNLINEIKIFYKDN